MSTQSKLLCAALLAALSLYLLSMAPARAAGEESMVVVRDPQTGKMRAPTPDELKALRAKAPPQAALQAGQPARQPLATRADGSRGVRLGEDALVYDVVTRGADGELTAHCVQGEAAARDALSRPAGPAAGQPTAHTDKEHDHDLR